MECFFLRKLEGFVPLQHIYWKKNQDTKQKKTESKGGGRVKTEKRNEKKQSYHPKEPG